MTIYEIIAVFIIYFTLTLTALIITDKYCKKFIDKNKGKNNDRK